MSRPAPESSRSRPHGACSPTVTSLPPTSPRPCSNERQRTPTRPGSRTSTVREIDGEALDELPPASFDAAISRVGLIYFPDQQRAVAGMRRALSARRAGRGGRLLDPRAQPVLLDPGEDHPRACGVAAAPARAARPVLPRRRWRPRIAVRRGRPARHRGPHGAVAGHGCQAPPNASDSSGSRSGRSTR